MIRRVRPLALLVAVVLVTTSCELLSDDTVTTTLNDVKSQTGVDFRDPVSVGQAAVGANTIGNKDAEDGLDVVKGFERADHEQKGDRFAWANPPQTDKARSEYNEALRWSKEETIDVPIFGPTGRTVDPTYARQVQEKRAGLYDRIAGTYVTDGNSDSTAPDGAAARKSWNLAAWTYGRAADEYQDPAKKAAAYVNQGLAFMNAGDWDAACRSKARADAALGKSDPLLANGVAKHGSCK